MSEPTHFSDLQIIETKVSRNRAFLCNIPCRNLETKVKNSAKNLNVEIHFDSLFQSLETEEIDQGVLICVLPSKWSLGKQLCQEENQNWKETCEKNGSTTLQVTNKERNTSLSTDWKWHTNRIEAHPKESHLPIPISTSPHHSCPAWHTSQDLTSIDGLIFRSCWDWSISRVP